METIFTKKVFLVLRHEFDDTGYPAKNKNRSEPAHLKIRASQHEYG